MSTVQVPSGLGVEIRDQGLPLTTEKLEGLRRILAVPHRISPREQVRQGQIGLLVAARLATRHGLRIELHPHASGTRALVVVPRTLLVAPTTRNAQPSPEAQPPGLPRRHAANPAAPVTNHSKGLLTGGAASHGAGSSGSAAATDQPLCLHPLRSPSCPGQPRATSRPSLDVVKLGRHPNLQPQRRRAQQRVRVDRQRRGCCRHLPPASEMRRTGNRTPPATTNRGPADQPGSECSCTYGERRR